MGKRHRIRVCIDCGDWLDECPYNGCPDCDIEDVEGCKNCSAKDQGEEE